MTMIDEPNIACFEKVAKSRVAKELLKSITEFKGDPENAALKDRVMSLMNTRRASKIYGGNYTEVGVRPSSKSGEAYRSLLTGMELPNDPLARRIVLHNELPAVHLQTPTPFEGYADSSYAVYNSLKGLGGKAPVDESVKGALRNANEYLANRYIGSSYMGNDSISAYYKNFFNPGSVGPEFAPSVNHTISAMGLRNIPIFRFRRSQPVPGDNFMPNSSFTFDPTNAGAVVLDSRKGASDAAMFAGRNNRAILEHELGHAWASANGSSHEARNRMARRLAVEIRKAQRAGGFNRSEFRVPTFRDILEDTNVASNVSNLNSFYSNTLTHNADKNMRLLQHNLSALQEAMATYAPAKLRGAKSAIMRHGLDVPAENIPGFESMSPELKRVANHIYLNYPNLRWS